MEKTQKHYNNKAKLKTLNQYFNDIKTGWEKGGFFLRENILIPYDGVVIKEINLVEKAGESAFVLFDEVGQQIRKMVNTRKPAFNTNHPDAFLNLYQIYGKTNSSNKQAISEFASNDDIVTLVLPTSPRAKIHPCYTWMDTVPLEADETFSGLRFFAQRRNIGFIFMGEADRKISIGAGNRIKIGPDANRVLTELEIKYEEDYKTEFLVRLGNKNYTLVAPGWNKKLMRYHVYGTASGTSQVVLALIRMQADMCITCTNPAVKWIINASRLDLSDNTYVRTNLYMEKEPHTESRINYFVEIIVYKQTESTISHIGLVKEKIRIQIAHPSTTTLIVQIPGMSYRLVSITNTGSVIPNYRLITYSYDAIELKKQTEIPDTKYTTMIDFLKRKTGDLKESIPFITVFNFTSEDILIDTGFYRLSNAELLHTIDSFDQMKKFTSSNISVLFYNDQYVWYEGDLSANINGATCTYKKIIWSSEINESKLHRIYLPVGQLPSIKKTGQLEEYKPPSKISRIKVLEKTIFLQQEYVYKDETATQTGTFTYMVDTGNISLKHHFQIIEVGFPYANILDLETGISIASISDFMYNNSQSAFEKTGITRNQVALLEDRLAKIIFPKPTRSTEAVLLKPDTIIQLGNKHLLFPFPGNFDGLKGIIHLNITEKINGMNLVDHPGYAINLFGAKKGDIKTNDITIWIITESGNKNRLHDIYIQKGSDEAKKIDLLQEFGLKKDLITGIGRGYQGIQINAKSGLIYNLSVDTKLTIQGFTAVLQKNHDGGACSRTLHPYSKKVNKTR